MRLGTGLVYTSYMQSYSSNSIVHIHICNQLDIYDYNMI